MGRKIFWVGITFLAVIALSVAYSTFSDRSPSFRGALIENPLPAFNFVLTTTEGQTVRLSDFREKIVLLFFGYASCPDVCPTTLVELRQVRDSLGAQTDQLQIIFVTVDPERDTPERIRDYVSAFDPTFIGLSGNVVELEQVWDAYGVFRAIDESTVSSAGYLVAHSARVYLIDLEGNLRLSFSYGTPAEDIEHDVRELLK
jgi:protein SCO1/2